MQKGDEKTVIDILQGKSNQLALGYYVVRNLRKGQHDNLAQSRDETERTYFATSPWKEVDKDRAGITSLKTRLRDLLNDITRREFPKIKTEIKKQLTAAENSLQGMGKERGGPDEQKKYLEDIAMKFREIREDVMATAYHKHDILDESMLRLPTLVAYRNDLFLKDMKSKGHFVHFEKGADDSDNEDELATTNATKGFKDQNVGAAPIQNISYDLLEACKTFPELQEIIGNLGEVSSPSQTDIKEWIRMEYCAARNYELDMVSPVILHLLWKRQSANWEFIARKYIYDIIFYVHRFTFLILRHVCSDERTFEGLKNQLMDELRRRYKCSIHQVEFILEVERLGTFITKNHYYAHALKKLRIERSHKERKKFHADLRIGTSGDGNFREESDDHLSQAGGSQSDFEHTIDDMHDILKAYYKVARKRFIDIVIAQAADYYLLIGSKSPLNILTLDFIYEMSKDQREIIAGEDSAVKKKRDYFRAQIKRLEEGKRVIEGLKG